MKELKSITDDVEFREATHNLEQCQSELLEVVDRARAVELEILAVKETAPASDNQWKVFQSGGSIDISARSRLDALRAEQSELQVREGFLNEALSQGRMAVDALRGRLSLLICLRHRPQFAEDARQILAHLRSLCDAVERTRLRRESLEQAGVVTGSLPYNVIDIGAWDDPYGNKVTAYRRWLRENYDIS